MRRSTDDAVTPGLRLVTCPGCGLSLPGAGLPAGRKGRASGECLALYNEVSGYTLTHGAERFIHQHLVDAYAAQHVAPAGPAIGAAFALAGLYLLVEKGFTGLQVQKMHIRMARRPNQWPRYLPPPRPGALTVADVHAAPPGPEREDALVVWCARVWEAWEADQPRVRSMVAPFL